MKKNSKDMKGKILKLAELLDYQKGSVVSMTLSDRKTGTVTLFAFDKGQGLSEHTAPFDAIVQIIDGKAQIRISGRSFSLKKGEMIIMPAGEPHSLKGSARFKMLLTMIRGK